MSQATSTDVVKANIPASALREATTWEEIQRLSEEHNGPLLQAGDVLGDGYSLLKDKADLVRQGMFLVSWNFAKSDDYKRADGSPGEFVSVRAFLRSGDRVIFNDGSAGIYQQLKELSEEQNRYGGLIVSKGLRVSEYEYQDEKGAVSTARTYYLDTSK